MGTLKADLVLCNLSRRPPPENIFPNAAKRLNHFYCDLSQPAQVARAAADVAAFLGRSVPAGRILLINNSGIGAFGAFAGQDVAKQLAVIDVNVRALVQLTGLLLPLLCARGGAIMNIASTVAFQPTPYAATDGASKAFVLHWTLALNEELRGSGVRALAVCPGTTATDFFRTAGLGDKGGKSRLTMTTDQVAETALRALAAGRAQIVPGLINKLYTFAGSKLRKSHAARIAGAMLTRYRPKEDGL